MPRLRTFLATLLFAILACGRAGDLPPTSSPVPSSTVATPTTGPAAAATLPMLLDVGLNFQSVTVDGRERTYQVYVPQSIDRTRPVALVLVFHGGGGNAENAITMTGFNDQADRAGFVAVYPNGSGRLENQLLTWNGGQCCAYAQEQNVDDVAFVRALLDDVQTVLSVDPARIYATGMSNGAVLSYRLACELSDRIAAIGPVAATQNIDVCQPERPVPVIHFHGTADASAPYEGGVGPSSVTGFDFASVEESIGFWVEHNGCPAEPRREESAAVIHETYEPCTDGATVELYAVVGQGHAWPGGERGRAQAAEPSHEISATELIWEFFLAHPMP